MLGWLVVRRACCVAHHNLQQLVSVGQFDELRASAARPPHSQSFAAPAPLGIDRSPPLRPAPRRPRSYGRTFPLRPRSLADLPPEMPRRQVLDRYSQHTQVRAGGHAGARRGPQAGSGSCLHALLARQATQVVAEHGGFAGMSFVVSLRVGGEGSASRGAEMLPAQKPATLQPCRRPARSTPPTARAPLRASTPRCRCWPPPPCRCCCSPASRPRRARRRSRARACSAARRRRRRWRWRGASWRASGSSSSSG